MLIDEFQYALWLCELLRIRVDKQGTDVREGVGEKEEKRVEGRGKMVIGNATETQI